MKALQYVEPGVVKMAEIPVPEVGEDEVLIKVKQVGVCGSDLSIIRMKDMGVKGIVDGFISGHEFIGYRQDNGQKVAVNPMTHCGVCPACRAGKHNVCTNRTVIGGASRKGAFAEYVVVPKDRCIALTDDSITDDQYTLIEPLATGIRAINMAPPCEGPVAIYGAGAIGLSILHELVYRGIKDITVVDLNADRLAFAAKMGAKTATELEGAGYEVIYDAVGTTEVRSLCLQKVMNGGNVVAVACAQRDFNFPFPFLVNGGKSLHGTFGYLDHEFSMAVKHVENIDTSWIKKVPFDQAEEVMMELLQGRADPKEVKLVFTFD